MRSSSDFNPLRRTSRPPTSTRWARARVWYRIFELFGANIWVVHDVVAERIVGVGLILFGAFLNGYGDLP
ncbi:MAG: hypothetical protein WAK01_14890 [Methylocystis sp.]